MKVRPFAAVRPPKNLVTEVAAPPYDVLDSEEARKMAGEKSLLHITKPEIDFDPMPEEHDPKVYAKAVENFKAWQDKMLRIYGMHPDTSAMPKLPPRAVDSLKISFSGDSLLFLRDSL